MQIAKGIYQLTGHMTAINSNTYAIDTPEGLVMIDCGCRPLYLDHQKRILSMWGLAEKKPVAVFLTHAHFDHAGNAHLFEDMGAVIYASERDVQALKTGGKAVMEPEFGIPFTVCREPHTIRDGETKSFGTTEVTAVALPGHTRGAMAYLVRTPEVRVLFTGDHCMIGNAGPDDEAEIEIGYCGSIDYDAAAYLSSFEKLRSVDVDIVAPGHRSVFYGDSRWLFEKMYKKALETIKI